MDVMDTGGEGEGQLLTKAPPLSATDRAPFPVDVNNSFGSEKSPEHISGLVQGNGTTPVPLPHYSYIANKHSANNQEGTISSTTSNMSDNSVVGKPTLNSMYADPAYSQSIGLCYIGGKERNDVSYPNKKKRASEHTVSRRKAYAPEKRPRLDESAGKSDEDFDSEDEAEEEWASMNNKMSEDSRTGESFDDTGGDDDDDDDDYVGESSEDDTADSSGDYNKLYWTGDIQDPFTLQKMYEKIIASCSGNDLWKNHTIPSATAETEKDNQKGLGAKALKESPLDLSRNTSEILNPHVIPGSSRTESESRNQQNENAASSSFPSSSKETPAEDYISSVRKTDPKKRAAKYKCTVCGQGFMKLAALKSHQSTHASEKVFKCRTCGNSYTAASNIKSIGVPGIDPYRCSLCSTTETTIANLLASEGADSNALSLGSNDRLVTEPPIIPAFDEPEVLNINENQKYECKVCGKTFRFLCFYRQHEVIHTGEKPFKCNQCDKAFAYSSGLRSHEKLHAGIKPYVCKICNKAFSRSSYLKDHENSHAGKKPYVCEICNKAFSRPTILRRHQIMHTGETPFKCKICEKCYTTESNLRRHVASHTGARPYKCDQCKKAFADAATLRRHGDTHVKEKKYSCSVCQKRFKYPFTLRDHELMHTGQTPFRCDVCGRGFSRQATLKNHKLTHLSEKPYSCSFCNKTFLRSCHLQEHLLTHVSEKPFECQVCHKGFAASRSLYTHMMLHSGQKPFKCEICSKSFSIKRYLKVHMMTHEKRTPDKKKNKAKEKAEAADLVSEDSNTIDESDFVAAEQGNTNTPNESKCSPDGIANAKTSSVDQSPGEDTD